MHRRVPVSTYLDPELYEWLVVEAKVHHITISEQVQRIVRQQQNLRKDLAALVEPQDTTPVFQVLLERHGEKVSKTMDGAVRQLAVLQTALDLIKAMLVFGMKALLNPQRFSQWEKDVQDTIKGRSS
jgi:hypothetical protein